MKRFIVAVVIAVIIAAGSPLFAQNSDDGKESGVYYVNISLERIFPYKAGYIVQYRFGHAQTARAYLPMKWFNDPEDVYGEIVNLPRGRSWPSMTVYYKDGAFSHVRLYVHPQASHQTWGYIPQNSNLDHLFEGVETLELKF